MKFKFEFKSNQIINLKYNSYLMLENTLFIPKLVTNYKLVNFIVKPLTKSEDIVQSLLSNILENTFKKIEKKKFRKVDYFENIHKFSKSLLDMKNCINDCIKNFKPKTIIEHKIIETKTISKDTFFKEPVKIDKNNLNENLENNDKKIHFKGFFSKKSINKISLKKKKKDFLLYKDKKYERRISNWLEKRIKLIKNSDKIKNSNTKIKKSKSSLRSDFTLISKKNIDLKKFEKYINKNKYETYLKVLTNFKNVSKKMILPNIYKNKNILSKINFKDEEKLMTKNLSFKNLKNYKKTFNNHTKSKSFKISYLPKDDFGRIIKKNYKDEKKKYEENEKKKKINENLMESIIIEKKSKFLDKLNIIKKKNIKMFDIRKSVHKTNIIVDIENINKSKQRFSEKSPDNQGFTKKKQNFSKKFKLKMKKNLLESQKFVNILQNKDINNFNKKRKRGKTNSNLKKNNNPLQTIIDFPNKRKKFKTNKIPKLTYLLKNTTLIDEFNRDYIKSFRDN